MYATITNIVAYLPFLLITGNTGEFIYSLPIVMTVRVDCLAAGLHDLHSAARATTCCVPTRSRRAPIEERRSTGLHRQVRGGRQVRHRASLEGRHRLAGVPGAWRVLFTQLKTSFFPDDVQYWSYIDVWLPNDANFDATNQAAQQVEQIIRQQADVVGQEASREGRQSPSQILQVRHHLGGRRQSALLVLGVAAGAAAQLRAGAGAVDRQGDHSGVRQPGAAGAVRAGAGSAHATSASCRPIPSTIRWRFASSARRT